MKTILYLIAAAGCLVLGFIGCAAQKETMATTSGSATTHSEQSAHPTGTSPMSGGYGSGGSRGY
jgi:hypothetical protein